MSVADHDNQSGDWARIGLRAWLVQDLHRTLRAAQQHAFAHPDATGELARDLSYHAGLLSWHLHKHRTSRGTSTTTTTSQETT